MRDRLRHENPYVESGPGCCPHSGASFAVALATLEEHVLEVAAPVVLVTGLHGTERAALLAEGAARAQAALEVISTEEDPERPLSRRLGLLREAGAEEVARRLIEDEGVWQGAPGRPMVGTGERQLLVEQVDLLDESSMDVLDEVIRSHRVGVLMTASGSSRAARRLARVLNGPRGLQLELATLSLEESRSRLVQILEEPPTAALTRYLHACSGGVPEDLFALARSGASQGWIGTVDSRSVVLRPPQWMDRRAADASLERLRRVFGDHAVHILRTIALHGGMPWDDVMASDLLREGVFPLEAAGLLAIRRTGVDIAHPVHRHALVLARTPVSDRPRTTAGTLHACAVGGPVADDEVLAAAWDLLEQGLLEQAQFVLQGLPDDDAGRVHIQACCEIAVGAPRRALRMLRPLAAEADPTAIGLLAFVDIVVLCDVEAGEQRLVELAGAARTHPDLEHLLQALTHLQTAASGGPTGSASGPTGHREERSRPGAGPDSSPGPAPDDSPQHGPHLARLGSVLLMTLEACRATHQAPPDAAGRVAELSGVRFRNVPIIAANWVACVLGASRLVLAPEEDVLPEEWFEGESEDRRLLRTTGTELLHMLQDLLCGEALDDLRNLLEDIWAQFDGGLPQGPVRRVLLEALDHAVEGGRAEELFGPPGYAPKQTSGFYDSPWRQTLISVGCLLDAVGLGDADHLERALKSAPQDSPHRRLVLRCLILRCLDVLPLGTLAPLIRQARAVGVEEPVVDLLVARWEGDPHRVQAAVAALEGRGGRFRVASASRCPVRLPSEVTGLTAAGRDRLALLSAREQEVTVQAVQGMSLAEISDALRISVRTVQSHVRNTYRKLGVSSRTELRAKLFEAGDRR